MSDEARPGNRSDSAFLLVSFGRPLGPASVRCSTLHQTQAAGIKIRLSAEQAAVIYDVHFVEYMNDGLNERLRAERTLLIHTNGCRNIGISRKKIK